MFSQIQTQIQIQRCPAYQLSTGVRQLAPSPMPGQGNPGGGFSRVPETISIGPKKL